MHAVRIDRTKPLAAEPNTGHNRYHPDIAPIPEIGEGEDVALETRDGSTARSARPRPFADLATFDAGRSIRLTGPVFVKGAEPGDMLEVEFIDILPQPTAFSAIVPGLGFLRDVMTTPFLVHWKIRDGCATSAELPGVRIPGAPFMGVSAVAPSARSSRHGPSASSARSMPAASCCRRCRRRRAGRPLRPARLAHPAAARERRQFRRQATDQGRQAVPAGLHQGRAVLDRRRPFRPRRRRGLRHRGRDGRNRRGALQSAQGPRHQAEIRRPGLRAPRLFPGSEIRRPAEFHRRDGHADQCQGRYRGGNLTLAAATPCST